MAIGLTHYLVVGGILFTLGVSIVLTRRNAISILMGVELILNSANINYVAFSHFSSGNVSSRSFTLSTWRQQRR
jgi:NADH-quinone oxidoreductase subunit K